MILNARYVSMLSSSTSIFHAESQMVQYYHYYPPDKMAITHNLVTMLHTIHK